jgi:hypothetical protein
VGQNLAYGPRNISTATMNYNKEIEDVVADWYEEVNLPNYFQPSITQTGNNIGFSLNKDQRISQLQQTNNANRNSGAIPATCTNKLDYKYNESPACNKNTGHMTQVVWGDSTHVGCAKVKALWDDRAWIWACNYNPPGNIYGLNNQSTLDNFNRNVQNPQSCVRR